MKPIKNAEATKINEIHKSQAKNCSIKDNSTRAKIYKVANIYVHFQMHDTWTGIAFSLEIFHGKSQYGLCMVIQSRILKTNPANTTQSKLSLTSLHMFLEQQWVLSMYIQMKQLT